MKNRLRELRLERGLRQIDVAKQLGFSAQSLGYYENWVNKPDPETLIRLADFYEVSIDYLLCREDEYGTISTGDTEKYTTDELQLIDTYRGLSSPMKELALKTLRAWKD